MRTRGRASDLKTCASSCGAADRSCDGLRGEFRNYLKTKIIFDSVKVAF